MSLIKRKARPLSRDKAVFRDDRLFIVACDDTYAPKQYFDSFNIVRIKVHVIPTTDGTSSAKHVLGRLEGFEREEDDELWMLLDTDHCTSASHKAGFMSAIGEARQRGVKVAISKPCFEVWLLLHHLQDIGKLSELTHAGSVESLLRETLGRYDKTSINAAQYSLASVLYACTQAEAIDGLIGGGDDPSGVTSRVYLLWKAIAAKALPSQLPEVLRPLRR